MSGDDTPKLHGTRKLGTDGSSIRLTLPKEAVDRSALEVGDSVMVASHEDGPVTLVAWNEDTIRDMRPDE